LFTWEQDIANSEFQHIKLPNNEDKPVSFSRDTQEIPLPQAKQCLSLFFKYKHRVSIMDDFLYYDQRQMDMKREKEAEKQKALAAAAAGVAVETPMQKRPASAAAPRGGK
jgi:hypothetical protein